MTNIFLNVIIKSSASAGHMEILEDFISKFGIFIIQSGSDKCFVVFIKVHQILIIIKQICPYLLY